MNRVLAFSGRNLKELLRDPLSYIFCLGFPLVMLVIMSIVNQSIPPEAGMTIFNIENLAGGIAMFGQSFIMLFTRLSVSKDRSGAFLTRLYASPMKSFEFYCRLHVSRACAFCYSVCYHFCGFHDCWGCDGNKHDKCRRCVNGCSCADSRRGVLYRRRTAVRFAFQ